MEREEAGAGCHTRFPAVAGSGFSMTSACRREDLGAPSHTTMESKLSTGGENEINPPAPD